MKVLTNPGKKIPGPRALFITFLGELEKMGFKRALKEVFFSSSSADEPLSNGNDGFECKLPLEIESPKPRVIMEHKGNTDVELDLNI